MARLTPRSSTETLANLQLLESLAPSDRKFEFRVTKKEPATVLRIREAASLLGVDMADFARDAIDAAYKRVKAGLPIEDADFDWANANTEGITVPFLADVPCGPLKEAFSIGETFTLNKAVADELEVRDGDFFVRADGNSMEDSGIPNGHYILMRPVSRLPVNGDITLVQFFDEDNDVYEATIKHWAGGNPIKLKNAKGESFPVPEGKNWKALAVARGVIGRL